jgi:hypothetical protein
MNLSPIKVWSKLSGSSSTDIAHAMSIGLDGSIYISGLASGILDGQTSKGAEDAFLTKYSTDGTKVWTKLLGTNAKDYALASATGLDGAIYIAGVTYGALDGKANSGDGDAFLTKYRTDGSKVWTTLLGGRLYDAAQGITVGLDGSIYITGQTLNSLDGQTNKGGADAFLTKYSSDGIKVWTKLLGTSEQTSSNFLGGKSWDEGNALTTGTDGSIYIAGFTYGSLDGQPHSGGEDAFLTKFNADGSKVWTKLLGSTSADIAYALTTGLDGSIYVTGITGASAYDSQISGTSINGKTTAGGIAVFLTKFNSDGEKIWTRLLDSSSNDIAYALTTGLDGSIYVGGYTEGVLDGQSKVGSRDGFLSKFSTDGTKAWTLLTGLSYSDYAEAIATGLDGSIYVTGLTDGSLDGRGLDFSDAFLIKYQDITSTPTYSVLANSATVNEGSIATFTLTTTNLASGTSVPYTLSGISAADVSGGSLSGNAVVNSIGVATISLTLLNDSLTEGSETLTISLQNKSASTVINDTSKSAETNAIYSDYTKHYYQAFTSNVSWSSALSLASSQSYRGLQGYLVTITSQYEDVFVSNNVVKPSGITGYSFSSGYKSFWVGASDEYSEGKWIWMAGPESGQTVYQYGGNSNNKYENFYLPVYSVGSADADYLYSNVPVENATLFPGNINRIFWDDLWNNPIMSGQSGNGFVVEYGGLPATYRITSNATSVNEGSEITFTLNTTNVEWGTLINYTISGVSSADITGGALSGTAIVSSNGNATITIPIASDLTTEGTESLTVTAQGISSSILISDTPITPVVVAPIPNVTSIPYGDGKYFYGSSGSDKVTGTSFVDVVKQTSTISANQLTKLSDGSWQIQNKITPSNSDNLVNVERVEFSDMSVALDVSGPAGQVAKILGSVFGPSYVSNTEFAGIGFAYLDGGMSYLDLCGLAAGAAGLSTPDLLVTTLLRNTTGTEPTALSKSSYLQSISNGASYASVVQQIADSSANAQSIKLTDIANTGLAFKPYVFPPTYSLSATSDSVTEGSTAVFILTTTNVAVGAEVSYTISGVSPADLIQGLTGKVTVGAGGAASIRVSIAADGVTEGQETFTVNAQGASAAMVINDKIDVSQPPTYMLTPATTSINEGVLAQVYVSTTNVAAGTSLQFGISGVGITQGDVIEGLSRFVTVDSTGKAVININTVADQLTEGPETMYITLGTSFTSIIIIDSPPVGVPPQDPYGY